MDKKTMLSVVAALATAVVSVLCVQVWEWETVTVLLVASLWFQYKFS